jgi:hypothetical protein
MPASPRLALSSLLLLALLSCSSPDQAEPAEVRDAAPDLLVMPDLAPALEDASPDLADAADQAEQADLDDPPELAEAGPWRSVYYPQGWRPGDVAGGYRLHDYSWAGYHHGEREPGAPAEARVFAVAGDPSGAQDSGAAIQAAIDAASAAGGGVVELGEGTFLVEDVLRIAASGVVLRGQGSARTRLMFTRTEGMAYRAHLHVGGPLAVEPAGEAALVVDGEAHASGVWVDAAHGETLRAGDSVALGWTITPAFIEEHHMSGTWRAFNDTWQPFFWREVAAVQVQGERAWVELRVPLRYPAKVRDGASLRRVSGWVSEVGVEALAISNAAETMALAWSGDQVHALRFEGVRDGWVRGVSSFLSPRGDGVHQLRSGGLKVLQSWRVSVSDGAMQLAQHRGNGGNGYLWEVSQSGEVLLRDLEGDRGRHNFIQNWGFGTSGCVWLRVQTRGGQVWQDISGKFATIGSSEFHHSLAMANLIDGAQIEDGWRAINRGAESSGAGFTSVDAVFWAPRGAGALVSLQPGAGLIVGAAPGLKVVTRSPFLETPGDAPEDVQEQGSGAELLEPGSLYEDQLRRRLIGW